MQRYRRILCGKDFQKYHFSYLLFYLSFNYFQFRNCGRIRGVKFWTRSGWRWLLKSKLFRRSTKPNLNFCSLLESWEYNTQNPFYHFVFMEPLKRYGTIIHTFEMTLVYFIFVNRLRFIKTVSKWMNKYIIHSIGYTYFALSPPPGGKPGISSSANVLSIS